jgi:hypothetical protein
MTPLFLDDQQTAIEELQQMRAGCLWRDASFVRQLGCRQGLPTHQRSQDIGAGWIADERADECDVWTILHTLTPTTRPVTLPQGELQTLRSCSKHSPQRMQYQHAE